MNATERLEKYVDHLNDLITEAEAKLSGNVSESVRLNLMEEILIYHKLMQGSYESIISGLRYNARRNKQQSKLMWAKRGFVHYASWHLKTRDPEVIAALASPDNVASADMDFVERAQSAWGMQRSDELRNAVRRFVKNYQWD